MIMPCSQANTSSTLKLYSLNLNLWTRKNVIVHHLITFIHEVTDLSETKKILNIQLNVLFVGDKMSSIYSVKPIRFGKAFGVFFIVSAILVALIGWWAILFEIGFSISHILSDYPLVERMTYLFVRLGLIISPPVIIVIGLLAMGKGPWILKEIVLEPDKIVFRRKNGKEIVLHEIKEVKKTRVGVNIKGHTSAGKLKTWSIGKSTFGKEEFIRFESDLARLYGEVK